MAEQWPLIKTCGRNNLASLLNENRPGSKRNLKCRYKDNYVKINAYDSPTFRWFFLQSKPKNGRKSYHHVRYYNFKDRPCCIFRECEGVEISFCLEGTHIIADEEIHGWWTEFFLPHLHHKSTKQAIKIFPQSICEEITEFIFF